MKKYRLVIITLIIITNLALALAAQASWVEDVIKASSGGKVTDELIPAACRIGNQSKDCPSDSTDPNCKCTISDLVQVGVNITYIILGVIGSLALLMFVYGGFMFLISAGSQDKITKAKSILVNAAIGILVVFCAWVIVNFVIVVLTGGQLGETGKIFNENGPIEFGTMLK